MGRGEEREGGHLSQQHKAAPQHHPFTLSSPPLNTCSLSHRAPPSTSLMAVGSRSSSAQLLLRAHPALQGGVGLLGSMPTRGGRRENARGCFPAPPGSQVDPELLWECTPSLPPSVLPPSRFSPAPHQSSAPQRLKLGAWETPAPHQTSNICQRFWGGEGGEGYVLGHPTPYTPRWGRLCVSVTISLSNGETEAQSHPGLPAQTAKRGNLGGYGVGGNGDLLLLLSTRDTTMKDNGQGSPSCIPAAPSWPGRIKHTTAELGTVGRGARGTG